MALNIKNPEVEKLAAEVAKMAHETKTEAIRQALIERKLRLQVHEFDPVKKSRRIREYLTRHVWPYIPADLRGKGLTKEQTQHTLGYGPHGV
jgi:antitoxin VapB